MIVHDSLEENTYRYYIKAVPEYIRGLCKPESVPDNFNEYKSSVIQGWRVLAVATKHIPADTIVVTRNKADLESDLIFVGFIIMQNNNTSSSQQII